jgi:leucyl-tRNA synthetase
LFEEEVNYPVSFNGKMRFQIKLSATLSNDEVRDQVIKHPKTAHYLSGKSQKKIIVVPKRIVNIVF